MAAAFHKTLAVLLLAFFPATTTCQHQNNIVESLFRFNATLLGSDFANLISAFDDWMGAPIDAQGAAHASIYTAKEGVQRYHKDCFYPPDKEMYLDLELSKKKLHFQYRPPEDEMAQEHTVFSEKDDDITDAAAGAYSADKKWTWRSAAHFSSRGGEHRSAFRRNLTTYLQDMMGSDWNGGRVSGTYWYPPGAVREWHTNKFDIQGDVAGQPWRMYYIRIKPVDGDNANTTAADDSSGMHLLERPDDTPEMLELVGAYALPRGDDDSSDDISKPLVWRVPDKDGFVTVFRLPDYWHCIVSDSAHRFSLGFAFSDTEVQAILKKAGIPFHTEQDSQAEEL